jgi:UDP-N-acetylmuramoyl-L-alanyl-D-glutamate--2,6-diaminopimelate ligase
MKLSALYPEGAPYTHDPDIEALCIDSRQARRNCLYGAFAGAKVDGAAYVEQAIASGAVVVVAPLSVAVDPARAVHLIADNPREVFAKIAARFYAPAPKTIVAVTGTNGKTSVAAMCGQIAKALGERWATIGTLGIVTPEGVQETGMTSPDVVTFHQTLGRLARDGTRFVAFEASSHALDQERITGVRLAAAGFTNLTRDHLDYHGTMAAYRAAKERLFDHLAEGGEAVINIDDPVGEAIAQTLLRQTRQVLTVGAHARARLRLLKREILQAGQHLVISFRSVRYDVLLPLVGRFQADNALLAAGMMIGAGFDVGHVFAALAKLEAVPGRLEWVASTRQGAGVYVDYAHTPDGLQAALSALRAHTRGKLFVVFGAGGNRDAGKRPLMGAVAHKMADRVIITDDNPRHEDAASIRQAVAQGAPSAELVAGREAAIRHALGAAGPGDLVLIAGKGHERGQIIGDHVYPFNDAEAVRQLVVQEAL